MRIHALILCLLCCVASAFAKDVITKTDGTKLDAKVEEISETVIKYRKASNPTGPVYTIPITSVATVLYENGDIDTFNAYTNPSPVSSTKQMSPSDDDLLRLADSQTYDNLSGGISDNQLFKMAYGKTVYEDLQDKAKKYRKIGWYGGSAILILGIGISMAIWSDSSTFGESGEIIILGTTLVAASAWTLGFNLKAYSLLKQSREMQAYSAQIIETEIVQFGENKLTAGINVMGNRMTNSHSLGVSLGLSF
ncbi:MAG: hypothetical protein K2K75_13895 [Muribaculaceae bacterium]|nr:hypothetical protein [Muribaculaceae bacterium]